jgi:CheY-like chemotaxis protein
MEKVVTEVESFPDWSDKTILIVDDVYNNCMLLEAFLGPTSATVIKVDNGLKAINEVKKNDHISFVLMDLRMPILDGYESTRRIKILKPWLPVIAISAHVTASESDICARAKCDAFLSKPFKISELILQMSRLFEKMKSYA